MCASVTSEEAVFREDYSRSTGSSMRTVKILLYSGILAMSAALPFLRFWEAEEAWNATTRVTAWFPSPAVLWWLVPTTLWFMMIHATLQRRVLSQRFYGAVLGISIFGGGAAGGALGPPKPIPNHPDHLLIDQALGLQMKLERRFVADGSYPSQLDFTGRAHPEFTPAVVSRLVVNSGICERVGDLLLVSKPNDYKIRICGLDGKAGGRAQHLRQNGKIMTLRPNASLQRAIFLKMQPEESPAPSRDGPRRPSP